MKRIAILIGMIIILIGAVTLTGCSLEKNMDNADSETNPEEVPQEIEAGGWLITVEGAAVNQSLSNVSVQLGYTGLETSDYKAEAAEGKEYCLIKMLIKDESAQEEIK